MGKTIYAKILTLVLICTMVFAGAAVPAMAAETVTGIETLNQKGTFDADPKWSGITWQETGGRNGACIKVSGDNRNLYLAGDLTPNTVVEITAWVKAEAGAGFSMAFSPVVNGSTGAYNAYASFTGTAELADTWVKVGTRVVLEDGATAMRVRLRSDKFATLVDDLTATYKEDGNILINGDFEEVQSNDSTKVFGWYDSNTVATVERVAGDNNKAVLAKACKADGGTPRAYMWQVYAKTNSRFKLAFDYKTETESAYPEVILGNKNASDAFRVTGEAATGTEGWKTYTSYITVEAGSNQLTFGLFSIGGDGWFDNVSLTLVKDTVCIEAFDGDATATSLDTANYTEMLVSGNKLTAAPAQGETFKLVANIWDASFIDSTAKKSVFAGIYKTDENNVRTLCGISVAEAKRTDDTSNTEVETVCYPGAAVLPLEMPTEAGEYEIQVFIWDGEAGLTPFGEPTTVEF